MTLARALLPYALISAAIVVCSVALVFSGGGGPPAQVYTPSPTPTMRSTSAPILPTDVRLAYWRQTGGASELWVSDLEGTRRWIIAREPTADLVSLTRWRPDGEAVSYVRERRTVIVAPLVGSPIVVPVSSDLDAERRVVVGYHWSPDGERIALSMRAGPAGARTTDVWTVDVSNGLWRRVTEMREGLAGPWIDEDEHLIESLSGSIFIAKLGERVEVWPVTGMTAVSPEIGPDGRLYVAGGGSVSLSGTRPYATGGIWSMALDGTDVRRELADEQGEFRLAGRWVDGRWLIDRGGTLDLAGGEEAELPVSAGPIAEVVIVHDRAAVALTGSRVLLLDPAVIGSARATPSAGLTVLVGSVHEAEAWRPRADVGLLRGSGSTGSAPLATFVKGNTLWRTEGSDTRAVLRAEDDHIIGTPVWSRDGAMVAVPVFAADPDLAASSIVVLDRSGDLVRRFEVAGQPVWSPDGDMLAVDAPRGSDALDLLPLDERASAVRLEGYDPTWTDAGLIVLTHADAGRRVHLIERYVGDQRVTILEESALATEPRLAHVGPADSQLSIHSLSASPDGQLVAFGARRCCGLLSEALVVARASDGAILTVIPAPNGLDGPVRWSPAGHLFARNSGPFPASNAEDLGQTKGVITIIVDARTGAVIARAPGEFAAWGGDGRTWYTARPEGLFASDLDGDEVVLVSPHGVPMQVAPR